MTVIQASKSCGNSPKNRFVQDVAISLETGEIEPGVLSDDVVWYGVTSEPLEGRNAVEDELAERAKPSAIVVEYALSHGKIGAANGEVTLANGHTRRFSHVLVFTSLKATCVAVIKSYA